jgi:hypothetical protein
MLGHEFGDGVRACVRVPNLKVKFPLKDVWFKGFEVKMFEGFKESWVFELSRLVRVDCCLWFGHEKIQGDDDPRKWTSKF